MTAEAKNKALQENIIKTKSHLENFSWHLKKLGRSDLTIRTYARRLKSLTRFCDLTDPEEVKGKNATKYKNNGTKQLTCYAYDAYLEFVGGQWTKPDYKPEHKQVFIPTEHELQQALNTGHKKTLFFQSYSTKQVQELMKQNVLNGLTSTMKDAKLHLKHQNVVTHEL